MLKCDYANKLQLTLMYNHQLQVENKFLRTRLAKPRPDPISFILGTICGMALAACMIG